MSLEKGKAIVLLATLALCTVSIPYGWSCEDCGQHSRLSAQRTSFNPVQLSFGKKSEGIPRSTDSASSMLLYLLPVMNGNTAKKEILIIKPRTTPLEFLDYYKSKSSKDYRSKILGYRGFHSSQVFDRISGDVAIMTQARKDHVLDFTLPVFNLPAALSESLLKAGAFPRNSTARIEFLSPLAESSLKKFEVVKEHLSSRKADSSIQSPMVESLSGQSARLTVTMKVYKDFSDLSKQRQRLRERLADALEESDLIFKVNINENAGKDAFLVEMIFEGAAVRSEKKLQLVEASPQDLY